MVVYAVMKQYLSLAFVVLVAFFATLVTIRIQPPISQRVGARGDAAVVAGFYPPESSPEGTYRWTDGDSALSFFGFEPARSILAGFTITGPPHTLSNAAYLTLQSNAGAFVVTRPAPSQRVYHTLIHTTTRWRSPEIRLLGSTFQPSRDDNRLLGVVAHRVTARAVGGGGGVPRLERAAFWALLVTLVFVITSRLVRRAYAFGLALGLTMLIAGAQWRYPAGLARSFPPLWVLWSALLGVVAAAWASGRLSLALVRPERWTMIGLLAGVIGAGLLRVRLAMPLGSLLLAGGAIVVAGAVDRRDMPVAEEDARPGRLTGVLVLGCVLIALVLRLAALGSVPFGLWRDEARHGLLALQILRDPGYRPIYVPGTADIPALLFYLQTVPIRLLGPTVAAVRLVPAVAGALTVLPAYFLGRLLLGPAGGVATAFLLAVSSWHIALSRLAFAAVLDPLFTLSALGLLMHVIARRERMHTRRMVVQGVVAGICAGLALYTYHSARLMPLAVVAVLLAGLGGNWRAWRRMAPSLIAFVAAGVLVALPLIWYISSHPSDFNRRVAQVGFLNPGDDRTTFAQNVEYNLVRYLLMWNVAGDPNARHHPPNAPMLDPITGLLVAAGALALLHRGRPDERLLPALLLVGLLPGLLSGDAPHSVRTVAAIAPTLLIGGWSAVRLVRLFAVRRVATLAPILAAAIAVFNAWAYFGHMPFDPRVWNKFEYVSATMIGAYVGRLPPSQPVLVPQDVADTDVFRYLAYDREVETYTADAPHRLAGSPLVLLPADAEVETTRWVHDQVAGWEARAMRPYPGTRRPTFWVYSLPAMNMPPSGDTERGRKAQPEGASPELLQAR